MSFPFDLDPYERDPGGWSASMLHSAELVLGCLDAVQARSVAEVGAYKGELTQLLLRWAQTVDGRVIAIDPYPQPSLERLEADSPRLRLIHAPSTTALGELEPVDAVILDGDHNYHTLTTELQLLAEHADPLPLVLAHDVAWPHGRRDDYWDPSQIPPQHRQPVTPDGHLFPDEPGIEPSGLAYRHPATHEGGPRNGVLTAAEDFTSRYSDLHLAVIPTFFGLGVIWDRTGPHDAALAELLQPLDRNPLLQRLEHNRVVQLASSERQQGRAQHSAELLERHEQLLDRMLHSRVFWAAELVLRLRHADSLVSRARIRRLLDDRWRLDR